MREKMGEVTVVGLPRTASLTRRHLSKAEEEMRSEHAYVWAGTGEAEAGA